MAAVEATSSCAICTAASTAVVGTCTGSGPLAVHADEAVVAFVQRDALGALIAPRRHVPNLSLKPGTTGQVLARIRRSAVGVQDFYRSSGVSVEPVADFPGAAGHACFRILPTFPAGRSAEDARLEALVPALQRALGSQPVGPCRG